MQKHVLPYLDDSDALFLETKMEENENFVIQNSFIIVNHSKWQ